MASCLSIFVHSIPILILLFGAQHTNSASYGGHKTCSPSSIKLYPEVWITVDIKNISYYEFQKKVYSNSTYLEPKYPDDTRMDYLFGAIEGAIDSTYAYAYEDQNYSLSQYLASCNTTLSRGRGLEKCVLS